MRLFVYVVSGGLLRLLYRLKVEGRENLPADGPAIIAANHASYLDPVLMVVATWPRWTHFMAKSDLFRIPGFAGFIRRLGAFPVQREAANRTAIDTALGLLAKGEFMGIYPQGARLRTLAAEQAARGVGLLAAKSGAPVVPVAIIGSDKVWRGGIFPFRLPRITVRIGRPLRSQGKGRAAQEDFSRRVLEEIAKLT